MKIKLRLVMPVLLACSLFSCSKENKFQPRHGDLLFQDLDCGPLCDAIESVTKGVDGAKLSHVALVSRVDDNKVYVIEAFTDGVSEVTIEEFVSRSSDRKGNPKVLVGRAKMDEKALLRVVEKARGLMGRKYDKSFDISDDRYYCSELIYDVFRDDKGKPVFELASMTFRDPKTGKTMQSWVEYFREIKKTVPEGGMGINPGIISRSDKLEIVHSYGCPDGWEKCRY